MWEGVYVPPYRREHARGEFTRHILRSTDSLGAKRLRSEIELEFRIQEQELQLLRMMHEAEILEFQRTSVQKFGEWYNSK
jgi:hypothetical protein